jgi:low affinity Fe/Cu permease
MTSHAMIMNDRDQANKAIALAGIGRFTATAWCGIRCGIDPRSSRPYRFQRQAHAAASKFSREAVEFKGRYGIQYVGKGKARMNNATNSAENRPDNVKRWTEGFSRHPSFESFSQKATHFISGPWGTITLIGTLASWAIVIPFVGWSRAYQAIDQFITVASFMLLFLIQRSQSKGMLSLQVKLNELLAAAHRASPELINVEDRTESEVQEIHDRFQEIQQRGPGAHSIADILTKDERNP